MGEKTTDIICVGETLIDFIGTQPEHPISRIKDYHRFLGGSPTNVAMNMARLGLNVEMVATIGNDGFGEYILKHFTENKVQISLVRRSKSKPTTVIFVSRTTGTPEFVALRGADSEILSEQISEEKLKSAKIFHTSCFALSKEPARSSILKGAHKAAEIGCQLSIDINYSEKIWPDTEEAKRTITEYCGLKPIVKVSQDDVDRLFGKGMNHDQIFEYLHGLGVDTICLTLGKKGAKLSEKGSQVLELSALKVEKIMDATGAGDAFWSGFLFAWLKGRSKQKCMEAALQMAAIKLQNVGRIPDFADVISDVLNI
ncbi:MAG: carbohydrate kinase [Bacteroidia bacterium]|nr:carbohydrate kinase [Bacteroidia bacterium]NNF32210.1 carbohydrate kinase [Flavobacteriaceae bacterium]MBT8276673.1 carbohydrate kinase [Bacteroidia bacterium]NNJ81647.1 carbohydrate kinase [Flavobacteriaceae bacterium]NNK55131.1 carbohydrate kinase [Flavobacteriaceae bacterium]